MTALGIDLLRAVKAFCGAECTEDGVRQLGAGNINDTYLVQRASQKIVLQKISASVFPFPLRIITNFQHVAWHLNNEQSVGLKLKIATPLYTTAGKLWHRDDSGSYWRAQSFLQHFPVKNITTKESAISVGQTLGAFHGALSNLDLAQLQDPIPGFHKTSLYLKDFDQQVSRSDALYSAAEEFCLKEIESLRDRAILLDKLLEQGVLFEQPVHGDPKVDNFIYDKEQRAIGLLDLDTVGKGLVHHDLGDCLRSCCNPKGEEGKAENITFDLALCSDILHGYFSSVGQITSDRKWEFVYEGVFTICFELGLRFFSDHLNGNIYFKVNSKDENLVRAINQFRLVRDIVEKESTIRDIVRSEVLS